MNAKHIALAALLLSTASARAADTLADMDIVVSPELQAAGIDPGVKHPRAGEVYHPEEQPKFVQMPTIWNTAIFGDSIMAGLGIWELGMMNAAHNGWTTGQIAPIVPYTTARTIYIEGGINNFAHGTVDSIVADYRQMLAKASPIAQIKLIGILPTGDPAMNVKIDQINAQLHSICTGRCSVVPSPLPSPLPHTLTVDGTHPNAAGQAVLRSAIH